jgi:hypothetical protein
MRLADPVSVRNFRRTRLIKLKPADKQTVVVTGATSGIGSRLRGSPPIGRETDADREK